MVGARKIASDGGDAGTESTKWDGQTAGPPMNVSRRHLLAGVAAAGLTRLHPATAGPLLHIGFIYVGDRADWGYNQSHARAARTLATLPGIRIHEIAQVAEGIDVAVAFHQLIDQQDCRVVFCTSYGYFIPYVLAAARRYPQVAFLHAGAVYRANLYPANVGTYFADVDEACFISGFVAGATSTAARLGFVAAKPIPQVVRNINAFFLGSRQARADTRMMVRFTGDWNRPEAELNALDRMRAWGADVVTCHVDSPAAIARAAEAQGLGYCGYHADQRPLAPTQCLTGVETDWTGFYRDLTTRIRDGRDWPRSQRGGFAEGMLRLTPFGPRVTGPTRALALALKEKVQSGRQMIFAGPLVNNAGRQVISPGQSLAAKAPELEKLFWLADGIEGELPR